MKVLGRAERVHFAAYRQYDLPAKVDTGAYSSSIDFSLADVVTRDGQKGLEFVLLHPGKPGYTGRTEFTTDFEVTEVKNANGVQNRYVIFPDMTLNGEVRRTRLTLADRSVLRYPVLIGRRFIREAASVVDVTLGKGLPDDEEERDL